MYVYSNLVKDSIIGGVFAPVMRVVALNDKPKNETVHREYALPHYLPLRHNRFNEIELGVKRWSG